MLNIQTFDNRAGGNVTYKALAHPLAAEAISVLYASLTPPVALYDPDDIADPLLALYPGLPGLESLFVHDVAAVGQRRAGLEAGKLTDLPHCNARSVLIVAFDAGRIAARIAHLVPPGAAVHTLDAAKLPEALLTNPTRYLDKLNFATNFVFFRDAEGLSTRLVSANYWAGYGARAIRLWLRLFGEDGTVLATWEQNVPAGMAGFAIDSRAVRARFDLPEFTGQLCIHAIGATGHDVVKYALDTYASDNGASLSCTHDANAWPSDRYAGLPAPRDDERVVLWLQNSHAVPIPPGAVALDRMGAERPVTLDRAVGPFATVALDVAELLPNLRWPAQIELRTGRHVVRPRYEVTRAARVRIAHVNVERADLRPDPAIPSLPPELGRGFLLPSRCCRAGVSAASCSRRRWRRARSPCRCGSMCSIRRDARWRSASSAAWRATTRSRWISTTSPSTADTPSWSMTSATAARPTAGCTRCFVTRTGSPATWLSPASADIYSIP